MNPRGAALAVVLLFFIGHRSVAQGDAPLGLGDLAAEHDALSGKGDPSPPVATSFRDLWERPEAFMARRVRVDGRVVRSFRQDAVGSFPALVEAWVEQPSGDLLCIVFPAPLRSPDVWRGATVSFVGVYLRRVVYKADGDRLAPLIVGPDAPVVEKPSPKDPPKSPTGGWPGPLATVGFVAVLAAISAVLAWRTLSAPVRRRTASRFEPGPPPEFLGPEKEHGDRR